MTDVTCGTETVLTMWQLYPYLPVSVQPRRNSPVPTPVVRMEGRNYAPESWHIICPHCGCLWATRQLVEHPNNNWQVKRWPCESCGSGSLWDHWNEPWNRSLGEDLLHREMGLIKGWYDRGIRTYNQYFHEVRFRRNVK